MLLPARRTKKVFPRSNQTMFLMEMVMQTTWIVAADSTRARVFEVQGVDQEFHEIEDFLNEAGREQERELTSDARGRFSGKSGGGRAHTGEPEVSAEQHETEMFAKRVCENLDKARTAHRYDNLFLIAYPKFLGLLRENLSKEAQKLIRNEIPKDISTMDERGIEDFYLKHRIQ
jgi:protein required for attachment to host cells